MPSSEAVQSELSVPLEVDGLHIGAADDVLERAARLIVPVKGQKMEAGILAEHAAGLRQTVSGLFGVKTHVGGILEIAPRGLGSLDFLAATTLRSEDTVRRPPHGADRYGGAAIRERTLLTRRVDGAGQPQFSLAMG